MTIEIKFRVWHEETKTMRKFGLGENYLKFSEWNTQEQESEDWTIEDVNDYPVMQYTGLKDKNGKEIYEGDIIKNGPIVSEIKFFQGAFCIEYDIGGESAYCLISSPETSEVIGNIYENPELLKQLEG